MNTQQHRGVLLVAGLLAGCGGASDDYEPPQLPPPPEPPAAPSSEAAPLPEPYSQATPNVPVSGSQTPAPPPPPPGAAPATSLPPGAPPAPTEAPAQGAPAPNAPLVYSYPTGQWVYLSGYGWSWVPEGATTVDMEGVPYAYLYTPAYGWTWYVSPWGGGPYRYGLWVRHPWHPVGLHGYWVAHPHVVVRLGRGRGRR